MRAVPYRVNSVLRNRLLSTVTVTLIVAVVCGVVIGSPLAPGVRRLRRIAGASDGEPRHADVDA